MSKLQELTESRNSARLVKGPSVDVLTYIIGLLDNEQRRGKVIDDKFVEKTIRDLIEANKKTIVKLQEKNCNGWTPETDANIRELTKENEMVSEFLSSEQSQDERDILMILHGAMPSENFKDVGSIMKFLKANHPNRFDKSEASRVAKTFLT